MDAPLPAATSRPRPARTAGGAVRARLVNPVVRLLLGSPVHRLLSGSVLVLTYTGRRSGVRYELPVMFADAGDRLVVIAGRPQTKRWWSNFGTEPQAVTVLQGGRRRRCQASRPDVTGDQYRTAVDAYRRRFPRVPVQHGIPVIVLRPDDRV